VAFEAAYLYVVLIGFNILSHISDAMVMQNEGFSAVSMFFVFFFCTPCVVMLNCWWQQLLMVFNPRTTSVVEPVVA